MMCSNVFPFMTNEESSRLRKQSRQPSDDFSVTVTAGNSSLLDPALIVYLLIIYNEGILLAGVLWTYREAGKQS